MLATGVYAWLSDDPGPGRPNAGVVIDADGLTLVDSLMVASQWEPFAQEVEAIGLPIPRLVLTSSHIEFSGGTSRFRLPAIYGSRQASALLDTPANPEVFRRLHPDFAPQLGDDLRTRPVSHMVDEAAWLSQAVVAVPTQGQMLQNLVAAVPGAEVCFAGAMCSFGVTPVAYDGDPAAWADALDGVLELAPTIVPGHGPVGGEAEVRAQQAYLRACVAAAGDPSRLAAGPWDDWTGREWDEVNVERAARVADGDLSPPASLLRRVGLS